MAFKYLGNSRGGKIEINKRKNIRTFSRYFQLQKRQNPRTFTSTMSDFPLHQAARENKPLTVEGILAENPKLAISKDDDSRTPLHWACSMNNEQIVLIILPFVKVDIDELTDDSGWTPLHIAASIGNQTIVDQLMATKPTPDVDLATNNGTTAIHLATSKNHYDLVQKLIDTYKSSVRVKDKKGITPLHRAAAIGSQPLVKMLVAAKANVNAKDSDGWTPLHHALAEGYADVGALLVLLGADVDAESNLGEKAANVACNEGVKKFFLQQVGQV